MNTPLPVIAPVVAVIVRSSPPVRLALAVTVAPFTAMSSSAVMVRASSADKFWVMLTPAAEVTLSVELADTALSMETPVPAASNAVRLTNLPEDAGPVTETLPPCA